MLNRAFPSLGVESSGESLLWKGAAERKRYLGTEGWLEGLFWEDCSWFWTEGRNCRIKELWRASQPRLHSLLTLQFCPSSPISSCLVSASNSPSFSLLLSSNFTEWSRVWRVLPAHMETIREEEQRPHRQEKVPAETLPVGVGPMLGKTADSKAVSRDH